MARLIIAAAALACVEGLSLRGTASLVRSATALPDFCKNVECPEYITLKTGDAYDVRAYGETKWVSTVVSGTSYDSATSTGFTRLFSYISGANDGKAKVEMTAPVMVDIAPGAGPDCESNFTVSFYVPAANQAAPPVPTDPLVYLSSRPARKVFVASYGGYTSDTKVVAQASALGDALVADGIKVAPAKGFTSAGYDSPFSLFNRHNEIWLYEAA